MVKLLANKNTANTDLIYQEMSHRCLEHTESLGMFCRCREEQSSWWDQETSSSTALATSLWWVLVETEIVINTHWTEREWIGIPSPQAPWSSQCCFLLLKEVCCHLCSELCYSPWTTPCQAYLSPQNLKTEDLLLLSVCRSKWRLDCMWQGKEIIRFFEKLW